MKRTYTNGCGFFVAVLRCAPGQGCMQVGIGESKKEAWESLQDTPIAGHLDELRGLRWACDQEDDSDDLYDAMTLLSCK